MSGNWRRWLAWLGLVGLLTATGCGGWFAAAPPAVTTNPFFTEASLERAAVPVGGSQQLRLRLARAAGMATIFQLTITYANGAEQQVIDSTLGQEATLAWQIPPDATPGEATFRLTTNDCGCGDRSTGQLTLAGEAEGKFRVR
ncbi:MAG: hypothetical protein KF832_25135 [Caldilineaceae bacterium]|nr:hypothetical protein [Caldilineaceae bacterium]